MKSLFAAAVGSWLALSNSVLGQGPVSNYYLTAGDQGNNWLILGTSSTSFSQANPGSGGEYAIAVTPSWVRTLGNGVAGNQGPGSEYDLGFTYTGTNFTYPSAGLTFLDGTSNGQSNFSVDFRTGNVYRMNLDWSNPTLLFSTGFGADNALGITYDTSNDTLWISQWSTGTLVANFSLTGSFLSSFSTGYTQITSLAYNPTSDSLWMGDFGTLGTFNEFSKTGTLLQSQNYGNMVDDNTLGGEFALLSTSIPEPATLALGGIGLTLAGAFLFHRIRQSKQLADVCLETQPCEEELE